MYFFSIIYLHIVYVLLTTSKIIVKDAFITPESFFMHFPVYTSPQVTTWE